MSGGIPPEQQSCPVCEMVRTHERGCPYDGLSIAEAWWQYKQKKREDDKDA